MLYHPLKNSLMNEIKGHYTADDFFKFSFKSLSKEARTTEEIGKFKSFEVKDKILYYNGRVCISKFGEHKLNIMNHLHDISIACHPCSEAPLLLAGNEKGY